MTGKKVTSYAEVRIIFPKASMKAKEQKVLFNKFFSLIEESKKSLPVKVMSNKRKRNIILDSDEFMFIISFKKIELIKILMNQPEENISTVNEVGNKVINYINILLGDIASNSIVYFRKTTWGLPKKINLCKKLIGEPRLAKINEEVNQTLSPIGIYFEYKLKGKEFGLASYVNEKSLEEIRVKSTYKYKIPFNLLQKEYDELASPTEILKKLHKMEQ